MHSPKNTQTGAQGLANSPGYQRRSVLGDWGNSMEWGGEENFLKTKIRVIFLLSDRPELLNVTCSTHFFGLKPYLFKKDAVKFQTPLR